MRAGIKEVQRRPGHIPEPFDEVLLLVDHRCLAQRPYGNRQVGRPRLANGFDQVLVSTVQVLTEQA